MSCSSRMHSTPFCTYSCCRVTNSSEPVRPCFSSICLMVVIRQASQPTRNGSMNSSRPPAHMRLRPCAGGMNPPNAGCPSGPRPLQSTGSLKKHQCHNHGSSSPWAGARTSKVAAMRRTRLRLNWSCTSWVRASHCAGSKSAMPCIHSHCDGGHDAGGRKRGGIRFCGSRGQGMANTGLGERDVP